MSDEVRPRRGRVSRFLFLCAVVAGIVVASGATWYFARHGAWSAPAAQAQTAPPTPPPVTVSRPIQREIVEWDEYTGQFAAVDYVELRAQVSGYLQSINFEDGQIVKKGDLLFQIDPRPFEIQRDQGRAALGQAEARLEFAQHQLARAGELRQRDFVAASTYDERLNELRASTSAVETAKAQIRAAELSLEFAHITAPLTGRIGRHEVSLGNLVVGGAGGPTTLLTTIVSLDPIYLYFDMSEADFLAYQRAVEKGLLNSTRDSSPLVAARLADEPQWTRQGFLNFVDNQVDRSAGTVRARGVFGNPGFLLTPGQFARIRVPASERYDALLLPDAAFVTDQSRKLVMTVKEDGTVEPKVVRQGPTTDDGLRIVRSGLGKDDRVIINGLVRARPGAKVTPQDGKIEVPAKTG
jgi:RND family efflux transporter MFP subunit